MKGIGQWLSLLVLITLLGTSCNHTAVANLPSSKDTLLIKDHLGADTSVGRASNRDSLRISPSRASKDSLANQDAINYILPQNTKEIIWLKAGVSQGVKLELRATAKIMLTDHEKIASKLKEVIRKSKYAIPAFDTANVVNINDKIGPDWDKAWSGKTIADHMELLNMFTKAQKDVTDTSLHTIITNTIPILKAHLLLEQKLDKKLK